MSVATAYALIGFWFCCANDLAICADGSAEPPTIDTLGPLGADDDVSVAPGTGVATILRTFAKPVANIAAMFMYPIGVPAPAANALFAPM
jgi:hypothetical protein